MNFSQIVAIRRQTSHSNSYGHLCRLGQFQQGDIMGQASWKSVTLVIDDSFDLKILFSPRRVPRAIMGAKASDPEKKMKLSHLKK